MKKMNLTKLMAVLVVLCLITSTFVGSTLAKYVTSADAEDSARVAKFGVVIQADGNLYGEDYIEGIEMGKDAAALAVQSSVEREELVAPGTSNEKGLNFSLNGIPEVATQLDVTITAENIYLSDGNYAVMVAAPNVTEDSFVADTYYTKSDDTYELATAWTDTAFYTMTDEVSVGATYYPVVYAADVTGTTAEDTINKIAADYAAKFGGADATGVVDGVTTYTVSQQYAPNFVYSTLGIEADNLKWAWEFSVDDETDKKDTILGQLIAQREGDLAAVKGEVIDTDTMKAPVEAAGEDANDFNLDTQFSINIKVTQIDGVAAN